MRLSDTPSPETHPFSLRGCAWRSVPKLPIKEGDYTLVKVRIGEERSQLPSNIPGPGGLSIIFQDGFFPRDRFIAGEPQQSSEVVLLIRLRRSRIATIIALSGSTTGRKPSPFSQDRPPDAWPFSLPLCLCTGVAEGYVVAAK
jgi:hypothetical protein